MHNKFYQFALATAIIVAIMLGGITAKAADAIYRYDAGTLVCTASVAIAAGDVILVDGSSNLLAVAKNAASRGDTVALYTRGVFDFAKNTDSSSGIGARWYWQWDGNSYGTTTSNGCATTNFSAGPYLGWCVAPVVATNDTTVRLTLNGYERALPGLPTSEPMVTGSLWASNGVLKVSR